MKSVLTIAGSDPSGGAGIQADLRVFAALGVAGWSAITALTVQNTQGVQSVHPVDADVLAAQIEAVLSDATDLGAVKIGMLGGAAQVRVVADALRRYCPPNVILDPVLASTGGVPLLDEAGRAALVGELMPLCDLITPNLDEAAILTGSAPITDEEGMNAAGEKLLAMGAREVLVKGGHLADNPVDLLLGLNRPWPYGGPRVITPHTHGTGCFLSSAIAAHRAMGHALNLSVSWARWFLVHALRSPLITGQGHGYPDASVKYRLPPDSQLRWLRGVYVVTDSDLRTDRSPLQIVETSFSGGAAVVQIRAKGMSTPLLIELARQAGELKRQFMRASYGGRLVIINDRVDVALAADAGGVHLGPDDMRPEDARRVLGPDRLIGVSVATVEEAEKAAPYASYFGVGAIYGSKTKTDAGEPIGTERIREIKAAFPHTPIVAIGGINAGNIADVARAGADAAAVVSAVVCAPDMTEATRELVRIWEGAQAAPH